MTNTATASSLDMNWKTTSSACLEHQSMGPDMPEQYTDVQYIVHESKFKLAYMYMYKEAYM